MAPIPRHEIRADAGRESGRITAAPAARTRVPTGTTLRIDMVGRDGIEPSTNGLKVAFETNKLLNTKRSLAKVGKDKSSLHSEGWRSLAKVLRTDVYRWCTGKRNTTYCVAAAVMWTLRIVDMGAHTSR